MRVLCCDSDGGGIPSHRHDRNAVNFLAAVCIVATVSYGL
jgi:hypothetical protein